MTSDQIHQRIQQLKQELDDLVKNVGDLNNPEVRAKGEELNQLIVMYQKLTGANPQVHSGLNEISNTLQ